MPLALAARYVGLSPWVLHQYVADGSLPVVHPRRPHTPKAYRPRPTAGRKPSRPIGELMRRSLFDRRDLDALVDAWKRDARP